MQTRLCAVHPKLLSGCQQILLRAASYSDSRNATCYLPRPLAAVSAHHFGPRIRLPSLLETTPLLRSKTPSATPLTPTLEALSIKSSSSTMTTIEAGSRPPPLFDNNVFSAEKIVGERSRKVKSGKVREFLIKWAGYSDADNTWEPKRNIMDERLMEEWRSKNPLSSKKRKRGRTPKKVVSNAADSPDQSTESASVSVSAPEPISDGAASFSTPITIKNKKVRRLGGTPSVVTKPIPSPPALFPYSPPVINRNSVESTTSPVSTGSISAGRQQQPLKHREHGSKLSSKVEQKNKELKEKEKKQTKKKHKKKYRNGAQENADSSTVPSASCTESEPTSTTSQAAILEQPPPIPPELTFKDVVGRNNVKRFSVDCEGKTVIFKEFNL